MPHLVQGAREEAYRAMRVGGAAQRDRLTSRSAAVTRSRGLFSDNATPTTAT